jgi:hypothetical protein
MARSEGEEPTPLDADLAGLERLLRRAVEAAPLS